MDFDRLFVFHTVVHHLSFSKAADDLYTSQPNVSRQVAKLESELGLPLFQRVGNRVVLTDAGRLVEDYAQRTFEQTDGLTRALNELKGLERGYLRLAAGSIAGLYVLPAAIAGFQKQHPGLEITLHIANSQAALERVQRGEADLAFVEGAASAPALQVQPYARDELVLAAAPEHELARRPAVTVSDIGRQVVILRESGSGTRQVTEQALARWQVTPAHVLEVNHAEALKQAVMAGLGVSFISQRAARLEISQSLLVAVGDEWRIPYQLVVASRKGRSPTHDCAVVPGLYAQTGGRLACYLCCVKSRGQRRPRRAGLVKIGLLSYLPCRALSHVRRLVTENVALSRSLIAFSGATSVGKSKAAAISLIGALYALAISPSVIQPLISSTLAPVAVIFSPVLVTLPDVDQTPIDLAPKMMPTNSATARNPYRYELTRMFVSSL